MIKEHPILPWASGFIVFILVSLLLGMAFDLEARCHDGSFSGSIGKRGACSHHGGVDRSRGGLAFLFSVSIGIASGCYISRWQNHVPDKKIVNIETEANDAPICPLHGKQALYFYDDGTKEWSCDKKLNCPYWVDPNKF